MLYWTISLFIFLIVFLCGCFFVKEDNLQKYLIWSAILLILLSMLQFFVIDRISHPSRDTVLLGEVTGKHTAITTRIETYNCGDSICSRPYIVFQFYLDFKIKGNREESVMLSENRYNIAPVAYKKAKKGDNFYYPASFQNSYLLNEDAYKITDSIRKKYRKIKNKEHDHFNDYVDFDYISFDFYNKKTNNINRLLLKNTVEKFIKHKDYSIRVFFTDAENQDYFNHVLNGIQGANINELVLVYSVNENNQNNWAKMATFADNDENHMLVADFESRQLFRKGEYFNADTLLKDLEFVEKAKMVTNSKFEYLSENKKNNVKNKVLIGFVLLEIAIIVFLIIRL